MPAAAATVSAFILLLTPGVANFVGGRGVASGLAFLLVLLGCCLAGPCLARGSGNMLLLSPGAIAWLAGKRLVHRGGTAFRASAGMVFAVLITTLFAASTPAATESLADARITGQQDGAAQAQIAFSSNEESNNLLTAVRSLSGISSATLVYVGDLQTSAGSGAVWIGNCPDIVTAARFSDVDCAGRPVLVASDVLAQLSSPSVEVNNLLSATVLPRFSLDPAGASPAAAFLSDGAGEIPPTSAVDRPVAIVSPSALDISLARLRPSMMLISYDSAQSLEAARTLISANVLGADTTTRETTFDGYSTDIRAFYRVVQIASLFVFALAACALALNVAAGVLERRQLFVVLRNGGIGTWALRRMIFIETVLPLVLTLPVVATLAALVGGLLASARSSASTWALVEPAALGLGVTAVVAGLALSGVRAARAPSLAD
ncbi:hypothetical protein TEK04_21035 [Klenkia sp. LSe6-5]|uniref:FtsX-like permease family protein n=1 Tax=Klenkia sesuvii TaxID=3103137 RepID=A0ABU8E1T7_9ACTN